MRNFRRGMWVLLFVCCLTLSAAAAEAPRQLIARVAVKSPALLVERLDEFASAATAGLESELPPGTVGMMAAIALPVSFDSFDADKPAQILFLSPSLLAGAKTDFVALLPVTDFPAFVAELSQRLSLEKAEAAEPFQALHVGRGMAVADLGDGMAAVYSNPHLVRSLNDFSWVPEYDGDSLIFAEFPLHPVNLALLTGAMNMRLNSFDQARPELFSAMRNLHIEERAANGILTLTRDYAPALFKEIAALEQVRLYLDFDGEKLTGSLESRSGEESFLRRLAASLEAAGAIDLSAMERMPASALSVGTTIPPSALIPRAAAERMNDVVFTNVFPLLPALRSDSLSLIQRFYNAFDGKNAAATFRADDGRQISLVVYQPADPAAALAAFQESGALQNRILAELIDKEEYRLRFVGRSAAGTEGFTEYRFEFADPALMRQAFEALDNPALDFSVFEDLRMYVGVRDNALFVLTGPAVTDGDVNEILARVDAGGPAFADGLRARDAMDWLGGAQAGLFLISADSLMPVMARRLAEAQAGLNPGGENLFAVALERAAGLFAESGESAGFSFGAEGGDLMMRGYVPVEAVNVVIHDYQAYDKVRRQVILEALKAEEGGDAGGDPYDYGEEPEDEEAGEEEMMLDAPAGAS